MRSEGSIEGALAIRAQSNQGGKGKKIEKNKKGNSGSNSPNTSKGTKFDFPPYKHCGGKGYPPPNVREDLTNNVRSVRRRGIIKESVGATLNRRP